MSDPFLGEIRMFAGSFAPRGWELCDGQLLPVSQHDALFSLLGTTYGGDGRTTFALPELRGRLPMHQGSEYPLGRKAGEEDVSLTTTQLPAHTHPLAAIDDRPGNQASPSGALLAQSFDIVPFIADAPSGALAATSITSTGGGQSHPNMQPFRCVNFIISLFGIYPSRS